ncbi:MAG: hypothetical protein JW716_00810 [Candidatus Aenigmarchaeota archaeon]|nr:hypothetical protein [Candidatus Aenigmarchaeota archaeon]
MVGNRIVNSRYFSISTLVFVCFLVFGLASVAVGFTYTAMPWNVTFVSDKSSYSCYPGCTAYINMTSNNATLNGVYNITFNNSATFGTTDVNFTIYNCSQIPCTEITTNIIENLPFVNDIVYPFMVEINMTEPLYGKWNFTLLMFNGTDWVNISFDPYIDSINLTYPASMSYINDTQPQFNFTFLSEYNTTINCTLFVDSVTTPYGNTTAGNATNTNITANSTLSNTLYSWFIGCDSDDDGTADEFSETRVVTIDNTTPSLAMVSPLNATPTYQKNVSNYINFTIDFTYTELYPALYWINITNSTGDCVHNVTNSSIITGGSSLSKAQNVSMDYPGLLADGNYDIEITLYDRAGNSNSTRENGSLVIDNTPAQLLVNSPTNSTPAYLKTINSTINFTMNFSYTEANPASFIINITNATGYSVYSASNTSNITAGTNTTTQNISLSTVPADGRYNINITMIDLAGNGNSTAENQSIVIDNTAPSVVLNTSDSWWDDDGNAVTFNFTATDFSGFANCSLWLTNSSGGAWDINQTNSTMENNTLTTFSVDGMNNSTNHNGTYIWNVQCYDSENNTAFASSNRTLYVGNRSDLIIYDITITPGSPYGGQEFNATVIVKNIGTAPVTNVTNVSFSYYTTTNSSVTIASLNPGEEAYINYTGLIARNCNTSINATADYGDNWTMERDEVLGVSSNNTRVEYISTDLNVTLIDVITYGSAVLPEDTVTLNISVKLSNGTAITGLDTSNITVIYDSYSGRDDWNRTANVTYFGGGGNGLYIINYTVPLNNFEFKDYAITERRVAESGNHSTKIEISATYGCGNYSGWANDTNVYNIIAPQLQVAFYGVDTSLSYPSGNTDTIYVQVLNDGTEDISNVTAFIQSNSSSYKVETTVNLYCYYNNTLPNSSSTWQNMECGPDLNNALDAEATALGDFRLSVVYAYGNASAQQIFYNSTHLDYEIITVTNSSSSTTTDNTGTTGDTSTTDECDEDDDCSSNYHCVGGTCLELVCAAGYSAVNHECVLDTYNYALKIMEITEFLDIKQGENGTIEFKIKNIGNVTSNVKINATSILRGVNIPIPSGVYHILQPFMTYSSTLDVNISETSDIGTGNITFIAYDKDRTAASVEYNITIRIQPNEETKLLINTTYDTYVKMLNEFLADFSTVNMGGVASDNYTKLNRSIVTIGRMLEDIKTKLAAGYYLEANELLKEVDALLGEIDNQFSDLQNEKQQILGLALTDTTFWIVGIVIVVIVGGILVYLLLPPKHGSYSMRSGYRAIGPKRKNMLNSIKDKIPKIKSSGRGIGRQKAFGSQKTIVQFKSPYMPGYERQASVYAVHKGGGPLMKLKKLVKKK